MIACFLLYAVLRDAPMLVAAGLAQVVHMRAALFCAGLVPHTIKRGEENELHISSELRRP